MLALCEVCGLAFKTKFHLHQHRWDVHQVGEGRKKWQCTCCGKEFASAFSRKKHTINAHSTNLQGNELTSAGVQENHSVASAVRTNVLCGICNQQFVSVSSRNRHTRNVHGENIIRKASILCPLCTVGFITYQGLDKHIAEKHGVQVEEEILHFANEEEFRAWKCEMERHTHAFFTFKSCGKLEKYYHCNRSGINVQKRSGVRMRRRKSMKLGTCCPARIRVKKRHNGLQVVFQKKHVGHTPTVRNVRLTRTERALLVRQKAQELLELVQSSTVCTSSSQFPNSAVAPSSKKLDPQRFHSIDRTRPERKRTLVKLTQLLKEAIIQDLSDSRPETVLIHHVLDHTYAKPTGT